MTIARLISRREQQQIVHCKPQETVREAAARLAERRIGAMPVLDDPRDELPELDRTQWAGT